ncbi:hypothetical protein PHYSODRAFT_247300 [Phytophthora sojae]|uniref:Uncharacterized protein n=1 Tax=Phytophthora sojae (strain P6497) TaxID=1094619 RepID=G4Z737_PHYSP|nr:hypothetical protein PHYSODRAFT_247300 [Phytophthora sojae]EGZ21789.1 hypothetical protein PHYSODRAFT_247300 [Phytophthora sojae]|eukprot:XP_009524506.1 hypothetical protein PHYSODRAFT_247300 [Phytophthora sojae]
MSSMKPRKKHVARLGPSFLHPDWTKSDISLLIEIWSDLETGVAACRIDPQDLAGGMDKRIAALLPKQSKTPRSATSISCQRQHLYKAVRFISRFDELQQESGKRSWFDLSKEEQDRVEVPTRERKACENLTRESFIKLLKLKSVKKWANANNIALSKPKVVTTAVAVNQKTLSLSSCHSCWSASELRDLVRSWSLVMKKSRTPVRDFVTQEYDQSSATLYTSWHHSTTSAWRKMKRLAASYLFIRNFDVRNAPAQWFQLSDGTQNSWMDWNALPPDFEDIPREIFDEIQAVDADFDGVSSASVKDQTSYTKPRNAVMKWKVSSPLSDNYSSSAESSEESKKGRCLSPPRPKLRTKSPHLPYRSPTKAEDIPKRTGYHQECNTLYEEVEQLQNKQFKQNITRLRTDIERDIRLSADTIRAVFFERLGEPGQSGDATFVANILEGQQRRIHERLVQFQREQCGGVSEYVFNKPLKR